MKIQSKIRNVNRAWMLIHQGLKLIKVTVGNEFVNHHIWKIEQEMNVLENEAKIALERIAKNENI